MEEKNGDLAREKRKNGDLAREKRKEWRFSEGVLKIRIFSGAKIVFMVT